MNHADMTGREVSSASSYRRNHDSSFNWLLTLAFVGSSIVLLLAGGFALYLMGQLGTAVERATGDILPKTLTAMRLSEHSALLAASAPGLAAARSPQETEQIALDLDQLKLEIDESAERLASSYKTDRLQQIQKQVVILAATLSTLKEATNERILLDDRRSSTMAGIRQAHSEFSDTVSPVVWGVASLTRLFGKRTARTNISQLKALRDGQVERVEALILLQLAHRDMTVPLAANASPAEAQSRAVFLEALQRVMAIGGDSEAVDGLLTQLRAAAENLLAMHRQYDYDGLAASDQAFAKILSQAVSDAREALRDQFTSALQTAESSIGDFVEQSVHDMENALNIKAEGNLLFAQLQAVAESDHARGVSSLQERFKRSLGLFLSSADDFLDSRLALRNPILAGNVEHISQRLRALGQGSGNLFEIRRAQLEVNARIEQLLASNRQVATLLNQHVEQFIGSVQEQAHNLGKQLEKSRGVYRMLLVMVFLGALLMLAFIAYFSIRTLGKQDREIRQAAMVFESTGEGIIITDSQARIVAANDAFVKFAGYARGELVGRHVRLVTSRRNSKAFYREMLATLAETNRWEGEIYTINKSGESQLEWLTVSAIKDNSGRTSQYVAVFSDVAIVKRSLQKLDHLAHHDILTGLPNRLLLNDRLEHAIHHAHREQKSLAVLFLDLDRFKNINDTLGHSVGDNVLHVCATRLLERVREGDTVARLGGDEFMILLESYKTHEDARTVARDVLNSLTKPIYVDGHELYITASIGISEYPDHGSTVEELVSNADAAMYRAKGHGKNNYQFYTSDLTEAAREKLRLESSLRLALEREEFVLHYQPKWDTRTGRITGVEALLRWQHPEQGLIEPEVFIHALEECGLILSTGKWVLDAACAQAQAWRLQGIPPIQMSVNLSGQQIADRRLLQTVIRSCEACGFDPHYLELELTEGFIMKQRDEIVEILKSLRERGMSIAIDDFGTGYSSLSYLKQLPIQKLKIDRSFVQDIPADTDDTAITSAIIALGHRLQMSIVAEGVETAEQLEFLTAQGCQEAQGFLFSEPLPEEKIRPLLETGEVFNNYGAAQTMSRRLLI